VVARDGIEPPTPAFLGLRSTSAMRVLARSPARLILTQTVKNGVTPSFPAVSKLCLNPIRLRVPGLLLSEKQIPQIVVNVRSWRKTMETLESMILLHTQEVAGSSPAAPTIEINSLQAANQRDSGAKRANLGGQLGGAIPTVSGCPTT
jgi:hypothetical protein